MRLAKRFNRSSKNRVTAASHACVNDQNSARHYRFASVTNGDNLARLLALFTVDRLKTVGRTNGELSLLGTCDSLETRPR